MDKVEIMRRIDLRAEINDLLGSGNGNSRRCWNSAVHSKNDNNNSLSFNPEHGGWRCHACGETGDLFTLYKVVRGYSYPQALQFLLQRYGLWTKFIDFKSTAHREVPGKTYTSITDADVRRKLSEQAEGWITQRGKLDFMRSRYGLNQETIYEWGIGYNPRDRRLWIPIFAAEHAGAKGESGSSWLTSKNRAIVNVRRHDVFRLCCDWLNRSTNETTVRSRPSEVTEAAIRDQTLGDWEPVWTEGGKVLSIKGHGCTYLYPFDSLEVASSIYLVGGELKALLLVQEGVPAVTFTCGEGSYTKEWLPYFLGKHVRILMDVDQAGVKATERLGCVLADAGAITEVGYWTEAVKALLPPKGDITDYLRLCDWNVAALDEPDAITWQLVERQLWAAQVAGEYHSKPEPNPHEKDPVYPPGDPNYKPTAVDQDPFTPLDQIFLPPVPPVHKPFESLSDPAMADQWISVRAQLAGRGEIPYIVPAEIIADCERGRAEFLPVCKACQLPTCGYRLRRRWTIEEQLEMIGTGGQKLLQTLKEEMHIPKRCGLPKFTQRAAAVEEILLTPPLDGESEENWNPEFYFAYRRAYLLGAGNYKLNENEVFRFTGQVRSDPKRGTFTLAAVDAKPAAGHLFHWQPAALNTQALTEITSVEDPWQAIISDLRDNVLHIYHQDHMLLSMVLAFFMPFTFSLGQYRCDRICPSVLILGDTTTGKSSTARRLCQYYAAGRMATMDSEATFVGLIGGNYDRKGGSTFAWGLLPASNGGLVAMDEYNKLDTKIIGGLTNTISSGTAERITSSGRRRTQCWVRLLYLANPRGIRRLTSYTSALDAALQVVGTVQDLGRLDYVCVQLTQPNIQFSKPPSSNVPQMYTKLVARYHLSWAWSLKPDQVRFDDPAYVERAAMEVAASFGTSPLLLPAQARWKVARIAAGLAAMRFSHDTNFNLKVTNRDVGRAVRFLEDCYETHMPSSAARTLHFLPSDVVQVLDQVYDVENLQFLSMSEKWTRDDIHDALGGNESRTNAFLTQAQFRHGLLMRSGRFYVPRHEDWSEKIAAYISEREKIRVITKV